MFLFVDYFDIKSAIGVLPLYLQLNQRGIRKSIYLINASMLTKSFSAHGGKMA